MIVDRHLRQGVCGAFLLVSESFLKNSQLFIKRVITVEIKTGENAFGALDQDRTDGISCVSASRNDSHM